MIKRCAATGTEFEITEEDLQFYDRVSPTFAGKKCAVPPPSLCPEARLRRRLSWRNERTLYRRKCDHSGKEIISTYAPEAPFPVYDHKIWMSDAWDPLTYGRDYDPNRPFIEQFGELLHAVPMFSLFHQQDNDNCPYTNLTTRNRNCHYIFAATEDEMCFYSTYLFYSRDVADCFFTFNCELCYECIDCTRCYRLFHSLECEGCSFSEFLTGCTGCSNCFGCVSLNKKEFCLFNEQLSAKAYASALRELKSRPGWREEAERRLNELTRITPRKYYSGFQNENFTGDHVLNSKNVESCFDVSKLEDCRFCTWLHQAHDCYDCYAWGLGAELGLENHLCGNSFTRVMFSEECWNSVSNLLYCRACWNGCSELFGCIGLRRSSYCILNKQYAPEEYFRLVPQIIASMEKDGSWGEFFPSSLSPYGYNETVGQEYLPLTREQALNDGFCWRDQPLPGLYSEKALDGAKLPDSIESVDDSICSQAIRCIDTGKCFKITRAELDLYRKLEVPIPRRCFDARYKRRFNKRNPRNLYDRPCDRCGQKIISSYPPDSGGVIVCESCYHGQL